MSENQRVSQEGIGEASGKNRIEFSRVSCSVLSDRDEDDIVLKLGAEDKTGSDEDIDSTQKVVKNGSNKKVVSKADLEEGEVFSEGPADGNVEQELGKKKIAARKNKNALSKEVGKNPETSQEVQNRPLRNVVTNHIWVSNINRKVKAADLKSLFGKIGKVCTAKILTNGKYFYGYVTMDNAAAASKCIRQMNNCLFEGEKIVVSKNRPDLRDAKANTKKAETDKEKEDKLEKKKRDDILSSNVSADPPFTNANNEKMSDKENDHDVISISSGRMSDTKDLKDSPSVKLPAKKMKFRETRKRDDKFNFEKRERATFRTFDSRNMLRHEEHHRTINDLRKKMKLLFSENDDLKQKLDDYQRRHNGMRTRCINLERELKKVRFENHEDRQRLSEEKELFEKKKKTELARIEADRASVSKELSENRKLRDQLKFKIEELKTATAKVSKRNRSPVLRNVRSPLPVRSNSNSTFRGERDREKRPRHDEDPRVRTPPSPPSPSNSKLIADSGRKRSMNNDTAFYTESLKRQSPTTHQFEYRHKPLFRRSAEASRPSFEPSRQWPDCFQKEPRRSNPVSSYSGNSRYGTGFPDGTSNISVPLRSSHNPQYYSHQW